MLITILRSKWVCMIAYNFDIYYAKHVHDQVTALLQKKKKASPMISVVGISARRRELVFALLVFTSLQT